MLHATTNCPESNISGFVTYRYDDGTECIKSVLYGKHIETWYFSDFTTDDAGIAWKGYTDMVKSVFWAEIVNPHPNKKIKAIKLTAGPDGAIYAVLGMTLSDRKSYKRPPYASHGGPDNWSGGLCMAALMEGLAGVTDRATAYGHAEIAPRWVASGTEEVTVTARYAASDGYVKYTYRHDAQNKHIKIIATSSGRRVDFNVLLPEGAVGIEDVYADHETIQHGSKKVEESLYATFSADLSKPLEICVNYLFKV